MRLTALFAQNQPTLSFEVFPPKNTDVFDSVKLATEQIAALHPDFMSVTYGAGGGTSQFTVDIAKNILTSSGVTPIAHLTCVSSTMEEIDRQLDLLQASGIENILALRGDIPEGNTDRSKWSFQYASDLISYIHSRYHFCIGGACYPEVHPESPSPAVDIDNLKRKVDAGCAFLTTQMFFDNNILYDFIRKTQKAGIHVPIVAGIMPVTAGKQIHRICSLSGTVLPRRFQKIIDRFGSDPVAMKQAGIAYATEQIIDLIANDVPFIHVYSMNKPDIAKAIQDNLSNIIK
ncbi:MAG: methylenetetrahydrofolate reductase [NAD(P)H] [Oscillospiraceae bacterium]